MTVLTISPEAAQALYDHLGTMPFAPGSWTHDARQALSAALGYPTTDVQPRIDVAEFRSFGYLQEVNRRFFFHPLGLALEVVVTEDGSERFGGIWDHRDDPEGIEYQKVDPEAAAAVSAEWARRAGPRTDALGYMVQPAVK